MSERAIVRTVVVDGVDVVYHDSVKDHGVRQTLVLVPGTGGSTETHFAFLFPILAARRRVVSIDWAPTDEQASLEIDDLVRQVVAVIEASTPPVVLIGYSLGAVAAAVAASRHSSLVERLVLIAGWMRTDPQQVLRNDVWRTLRAETTPLGLARYTTFCAFGAPYLASKTAADIDRLVENVTIDRHYEQQMDLNRRIDIREDAVRIAAPTLIIGCTHDTMVPLRHQKELFGAVIDARLAEVGTGHAAVFERPSELTHHIQRFVDDPSAHPAGSIIRTVTP